MNELVHRSNHQDEEILQNSEAIAKINQQLQHSQKCKQIKTVANEEASLKSNILHNGEKLIAFFDKLTRGYMSTKKGTLSEEIFPPHDLTKQVKKMQSETIPNGHGMVSNDLSLFYNKYPSHVVVKNDLMRFITAVPIYEKNYDFFAYSYTSAPFAVKNDHKHFYHMDPSRSILLLSRNEDQYVELSQTEFEKKCTKYEDSYSCPTIRKLRTDTENSCLLALKNSQFELAVKRCTDAKVTTFEKNVEYFYPLGGNKYKVFYPSNTIYLICPNDDEKPKTNIQIKHLEIVELSQGCMFETTVQVIKSPFHPNEHMHVDKITYEFNSDIVHKGFQGILQQINESKITLGHGKNLHIQDHDAHKKLALPEPIALIPTFKKPSFWIQIAIASVIALIVIALIKVLKWVQSKISCSKKDNSVSD